MIRRTRSQVVTCLLVLTMLCAIPAQAAADSRLIVRAKPVLLLSSLTVVTNACNLVGCSVLYGLDGVLGNLYLVSVPDILDVRIVTSLLSLVNGIVAIEPDVAVHTEGKQNQGEGGDAPPALLDKDPVSYYGTSVRGGYVRQPAYQILGLAEAQSAYNATGKNITVAVIDTGVDPTHPVLSPVLLPGYDFTRNRAGGSERDDVNQSTMTVLDEGKPGWVNQSTMAVLDQSTMTVLDGPEYRAFGHGTIVAGIVHLTAPEAKIMPMKAFRADGSGVLSDVLRAIYESTHDGAKVINMSFSFDTNSKELAKSIEYATGRGVVAVSSAGNDGQKVDVYPASLSTVMGVASTTDWDTLSSFSNYGTSVAWIAAPGEAIVSTYPLGTYAAAWGTSFSAPFASGAAALLAEIANIGNKQAADAEGAGVWISHEISKGRLDVPSAIRAWRDSVGLP
jgi:subtilisin family serine protease